MLRCPHCEQPGIGALGKLISSELTPARCRACGKLSALTSFSSRLLTQLVIPALIVVGFVAFDSASLLLFIGGSAAVCALWVAGSLLLPANPIIRREFKIDL
mgnify:CR=1 FL=1